MKKKHLKIVPKKEKEYQEWAEIAVGEAKPLEIDDIKKLWWRLRGEGMK